MDDRNLPAEGRARDHADDTAAAPLRTVASTTWTALALGTVTVILILIFILQNLGRVEVSFLVFSGTLPLGVAILCGAVAGVIITFTVGAARILQLRLAVRASSRRINSPGGTPPGGSPLDRPAG